MMTRRETLLASGSAVTAAGLGGCGSTKASRSSSRLGAVHDLLAEQVARDQFPGAARGAAAQANPYPAIWQSQPFRLTMKLIQIGAKGDVQPFDTG